MVPRLWRQFFSDRLTLTRHGEKESARYPAFPSQRLARSRPRYLYLRLFASPSDHFLFQSPRVRTSLLSARQGPGSGHKDLIPKAQFEQSEVLYPSGFCIVRATCCFVVKETLKQITERLASIRQLNEGASSMTQRRNLWQMFLRSVSEHGFHTVDNFRSNRW